MEYQLIERMPTSEELIELRKSVGWGPGEKRAIDVGLKNSLYGVCVVIEGRTIGVARVIGDGGFRRSA